MICPVKSLGWVWLTVSSMKKEKEDLEERRSSYRNENFLALR